MSAASILFTFQNARGNFADLPTLADGQLYFTEDTKQLYIGTPSGNLAITSSGGIFPITINAVAHEWLNSYNAATGLFTQSQPAYSDISGTPQLAQTFSPISHEFVIGYNATTGLFTAAQPAYSDISGTPTLPVNTPSVSHEFLTSYDSSTGIFGQAQPAFSDLSGSIASGQIPALTITVGQIDATGTPSSTTFLRGDGSWATVSGGSSVSVNGSTVSNPNFNGTTPSAPAGHQLVIWQSDGLGNVSAYIPSSLPPDGSAGGDLSGTYPNPTVAKVNGGTIPLSKTIVGTNGSGQIVDATSSTLPTSMFPALTGDVTNTAGSLTITVGKVNGGAVPTSKTIVGTNSSGQIVDATSATLSNNTTGTAANLSGTPALPNGTTATTQAAGTSNTELATTAFVQAALPLFSKTFTISAANLILSDQSNPSYTPITLVTPGGSQVVIVSSLAFSYTGGTHGWAGGQGQVGYNESGTVIFTPSGGIFPPGGDALLVDGNTPISVFTPTAASSYDGTGACIGKTLVFSAQSVYNVGPILTASVTSGTAGTGYAPGDTGNISGGDNNAAYTVNTVNGSGGVLTFTITAGGQDYQVSTGNGTTVSSGSGDGAFEVNILTVGQPNGTATLTLLYYLVTA